MLTVGTGSTNAGSLTSIYCPLPDMPQLPQHAWERQHPEGKSTGNNAGNSRLLTLAESMERFASP